LDVARSDVPPEQYGNLFHPAYTDARASRAMGTVAQAKRDNPTDQFIQRPDGVWQPNTPFYQHYIQPTKEKSAPEVSQQQFLKQHPMVTMGVLPIPSAGKIEHALAVLNSPEPTVTQPTGHQAPGSFAEQQADYEAMARENYLKAHAGGVETLKQAQTELNSAMGTNLPVTGVFNQTWTDAVGNWMKTTDYAKKEL